MTKKRPTRWTRHFTHEERAEILRGCFKRYFADSVGMVCVLALIVVAIGPLSYARGDKSGLATSLFVAFSVYFVAGRIINRLTGLVCALTMGLISGFFVTNHFGYVWVIEFTLLVGFALGFSSGLLLFFGDKSFGTLYFDEPAALELPPLRNLLRGKSTPNGTKILTMLVLGAIVTTVGSFSAYRRSRIEITPVHFVDLKALLPVFLGALFSLTAFPFGFYVGRKVRPSLKIFSDIWVYLSEMSGALLGYIFGYFVIAFVFAGFYGAFYRYKPVGSFEHLPVNPTFGDFFYFSIVTISTLGYGDIVPASIFSKLLVGLETTLGIGWTTIVFATVFAHMQPRFAVIASQRRDAQVGESSERRNSQPDGSNTDGSS